MAQNAPNLKTVFSSDTSDLSKGVSRAKRDIRDYEKTSSDALSSIGAAFGVNTQKIEQVSGALRGLGAKMEQAGNSGVQAFGAILKSIGPVAGGIAGLGLGAAITGFRLLRSEADAFKESINGANIEMATAAYVDTFRGVLHDMNSDTGRSIAEQESNLSKMWGRLTATIGHFFTSGAFGGPTSSLKRWAADVAVASVKAPEGENISNELYELRRQKMENIVSLAKIDQEIAEAQLAAKEAIANKDADDALIQIANAQALINQRAALQIPIEEEISRLLHERNNITSDDNTSLKDIEEAARQDASVLALKKQQADAERQLLELQTAARNIAAANAKEREKIAAATAEELANQERIAKLQKENVAITADFSGPLNQVQVPVELITPDEDVERFRWHLLSKLGKGITLAVGLEADTKTITDLGHQIEAAISDVVSSLAENLGTLFADLINGEDAFGNFASSAMASFGEMAVMIGKIAIQAGTAALAIQSALALDPTGAYLAIAAGAALVMLGSAVKAGFANAASGNYSASTSVASATSSSMNSNGYETREIYVNVTGTLRGDGDSLLATITNANKKRNLTT